MAEDTLYTPGTASQRCKVSLQLVRMRCRDGSIQHERDAGGRRPAVPLGHAALLASPQSSLGREWAADPTAGEFLVYVPAVPRKKQPYPDFLRKDSEGKASVSATLERPFTQDEAHRFATKDGRPWRSWGAYLRGPIIVLDCDDFAGVAKLFSDLTDSLIVASGAQDGNRCPIYYRLPEGHGLTRSRYVLPDGLGEVKMGLDPNSPQFVIMPGALHKSGRAYWVVPGPHSHPSKITLIPTSVLLSEQMLVETTNQLRPVRFAAGEQILRQGDLPDRFYIVTKGEAVVRRQDEPGQERELATLSPGQYFGEIGLLSLVPRTASVYAKTPVELLALDRVVANSGTTAEEVAKVARHRLAQTAD